ncbi:MAG: LysM peptidoglycan-binding domain-containing protein [Gammaproteobacteria bacterium]|nr:LysM peptidoglycan-binding domain-containing protein [Gammaproteobacteria bacterium]
MNKWLPSSLILGAAVLSACASSHPATHNKIPTRQASAPAKLISLAPEYRTDAPDRYIVQRGDTLWGISARFLKHPGQWKQIWHANPQIKNPNKIYPGDVISYVTVGGKRKLQVAGSNNPVRNKYTGEKTADGRPIYKLSPTVQTEYMEDPIPTVPKHIVYPFMTKNMVMEEGFSQDYPYIIGQADGNYISLSGRQEVYARSDDGSFSHELYDVFRESNQLTDPANGASLGVEAIYVGRVRLVKEANEDGIGTFVQTDSVNPLYPKDILVPSKEAVYGEDLNFLPKLVSLDDDAMIVKPIGMSSHASGSQFSTVLVNKGNQEGMQTGDVFNIVRAANQKGTGRDGESYTLPNYQVGIAMVYKTFENSSYALVMNAYDVIYPGDRAVTP